MEQGDWAMRPDWEERFKAKITEAHGIEDHDPAHDLAHFSRVVATAKRLAQGEGGKLEVILPAAWLHDLVNVPKNDPRRSQASRLSAQAALAWLNQVGYPEEFHAEIGHAIEAHSFSAQIEPKTIEAKIVQDADRLDGLGAVGIARVFAVAGLLRRPLYNLDDPFAIGGRPLNDLQFTVDHFYAKLFLTARTLRTEAGRREGEQRVAFMRQFLRQLGVEIGVEEGHVRLD